MYKFNSCFIAPILVNSSTVVEFVRLLVYLFSLLSLAISKWSKNLNFSVIILLLFYPTDEDFFAKDVKSVKK